MNSQLKVLFAAIVDNEIVCFDTNLSAFSKAFQKIEPKSPNYDKFHRLFKEHRFTLPIGGKEYFFQKLLP